MTRTARIASAAFAALALTAPAASAEQFEASFGAGQKNAFAWEGTVSSGPPIFNPTAGWYYFGCVQEPVTKCDSVLLDVKDTGVFTATVDAGEQTSDPAVGVVTYPDVDLYLYASDAEGTYADDAEPVASAATYDQVETISASLSPGHYVLEVMPFQSVEADYTGSATFAVAQMPKKVPTTTTTPPSADPAPATTAASSSEAQPAAADQQPAPGAAPAPAAAPTKRVAPAKAKAAACAKKARKIKSAKKRKAALKRCAKARKR